MTKEYNFPVIEIIGLSASDVLTASNPFAKKMDSNSVKNAGSGDSVNWSDWT